MTTWLYVSLLVVIGIEFGVFTAKALAVYNAAIDEGLGACMKALLHFLADAVISLVLMAIVKLFVTPMLATAVGPALGLYVTYRLRADSARRHSLGHA